MVILAFEEFDDGVDRAIPGNRHLHGEPRIGLAVLLGKPDNATRRFPLAFRPATVEIDAPQMSTFPVAPKSKKEGAICRALKARIGPLPQSPAPPSTPNCRWAAMNDTN